MPTRSRSDSAAARKQQTAAAASLVASLFLVVIKTAAGFASGSISVLAEGLQSTMDVIASGLILVTVRAAAAPPDRSHPYGHGKFENVASLGQMILILATAGYLFTAAWRRWQEPVMPRLDWGAAAMTVALFTDLLMARWLSRVAAETGSQALAAEAAHLRSDMLACIGVLGGLLLVGLTGQPRLDPLFAALMTVIVVWSAARMLRETLRPLLDESLPAEEEDRVCAVLNADPRVLGYHRLRTRRAGAHRLIDLHVLLDDRLSFAEAHDVAEEVEHAIRCAFPRVDVIVHAEPFEAELQHQREHHHTPE